MTLSLITGCGTKNEEVSEQKEGTAQTEAVSVSEQGVLPIVDEPIELTVMVAQNPAVTDYVDVYKRQIQTNKEYLGEIDGLIGDGDHGMNMNKGFTLYEEYLGTGNTLSLIHI